MKTRSLLICVAIALFCVPDTFAQTPPAEIHDGAAYDAWKAQVAAQTPVVPVHPGEDSADRGGADTIATCNCWITPDLTYTTINNATQWTATGFGNGDDGSYGPVALPFSFYLYGQYYTQCYININGNISFGGPIGTYSASGFPTSGNAMVAPFWADVDLRGGNALQNKVQYKVTSNALYVNWTNVGYYNQQLDKLNSFQVILKAGDPTLDGQPNVHFCYGEMNWTTGSASGGSNGFGGTAANVGANKGDGVNYIQFGRFNHAGIDYNGPFGAPSGVNWLTDKTFSFATDITTGNLAPVVTGQSVCDEIFVCTGETVYLGVQFLSPEPTQVTTITSTAPGLPNYAIISNTPGQTAEITTSFTALTAGTYEVTFTGTDNGSPPLSTTLTVMVNVFTSPTDPPVITGVLGSCEGQGTVLSVADSSYSDYVWSNGYNGPTVLVGPGTYTVSVGHGNCLLTSEPVTVTSGAPPTAHFTSNPEGQVFTGNAVTYTDNSNPNGSTIVSWSWSNDVLGTASGQTWSPIFTQPGEYPITLTVTTAEGCTSSYTYIQIVIQGEVILPNVFTPNGDGHNDALVFEGAQHYPNTSLKVMNRWGKEVFSSGNYKNTWKPTKDVPDGTYFYILKLYDGTEYTGSVTLLR